MSSDTSWKKENTMNIGTMTTISKQYSREYGRILKAINRMVEAVEPGIKKFLAHRIRLEGNTVHVFADFVSETDFEHWFNWQLFETLGGDYEDIDGYDCEWTLTADIIFPRRSFIRKLSARMGTTYKDLNSAIKAIEKIANYDELFYRWR
jgi:hypothetical protein